MTNTVNNEGLNVKDLFIALIVSLVLMFLAGSGYAQGIATAKAADATEVVSAGSEIKPAIVVPAKLVKAMEAAKVGAGKSVKKAGKKSNVQTDLVYFQFDNSGNLIPLTAAQVASNTLPPSSNPYSCVIPGPSPCSAGYNPDDVIEYDPINHPGMYLPSNSGDYQDYYTKPEP